MQREQCDYPISQPSGPAHVQPCLRLPTLYIFQLFIPKASALIPLFTVLPLIHPPTYLAVLVRFPLFDSL